MIDFDQLEKQDPVDLHLSRSGSGTSLPGERPASEPAGGTVKQLSRSGSQASLTSPARAPDGPSISKGRDLRIGQYQRQTQDPLSPKPFKRELDAAIQGIKEEMKLFLAQQKVSLQNELHRDREPLNAELKRMTERQKAMEDRIEEEMTEVTKGMTKLSEEAQKPSKVAEDAMKGFDKLHKEFKKIKERLEEVEKRVQLVQQGFMESKILEKSAEEELAQVKKEVARLGEAGEQPLKLADRFEAEIWEVRNEVAKMAERDVPRETVRMNCPVTCTYLPTADVTSQKGITDELTDLRRHTAELKTKSEQMQQELANSTGSIREELIRLTDLTVSGLSRAEDLPSNLESLRQEVAALRERSTSGLTELALGMEANPAEDDVVHAIAAVKKELSRAKELFQSGQKSAGVVLSDIVILKQDLQALKQSQFGCGEASVEQLRNRLRRELADEVKSLITDLIPKQACTVST